MQYCNICVSSSSFSRTDFNCERCSKYVCGVCIDIIKRRANCCPYCRFEFENNNLEYNANDIVDTLDRIFELEYPRISRRNRRNRAYSNLIDDRIPLYIRQRRENRKRKQKERKQKRNLKWTMLFPFSDDLLVEI